MKTIIFLPNLGQERGWQFFLGNLKPVEGLKPPVIFNVVGSIFKAAVALSDVCHQEMLYKTLCISIKIKA
jgi:hypothetical protein